MTIYLIESNWPYRCFVTKELAQSYLRLFHYQKATKHNSLDPRVELWEAKDDPGTIARIIDTQLHNTI